MKFSPTLIAALVAIGAAGFFLGRISSSPRDDAATTGTSGRPGMSPSGSTLAGNDAARPAKSSRSSERRTSGMAKVTGTEALARLEAIIRGENPLDRGRALLAYIDQLEPGEFEAAVAHFRSLGITESRFGEYGMLLSAWAQADPFKALEYVRANTNSGFALNTVLSAWAGKDPDSAIAWAQTNHTGDGANPFMAGIIRAIAATDTARASDLLTAMPRSRERGEALDGFLSHLVNSGPETARQWVDSLSDEALKNGSMARLADLLANIDPAGTAKWLLANPGDALNDNLDNVLGTWAGKDRQAALSFFKTLPEGDARNGAFRGIVAAVASSDPKSAASLIDTHSGDADNGAIRSFVWHSFGQDPALALDYVARLTDAGDRERTYRRTLEFWMDRDPAQAQSWIQQSGSSVPQKVIQDLQRRAAERAGQGG